MNRNTLRKRLIQTGGAFRPNVTGFEQDIEKYIGENSLPEPKLRNGSHPFRLDFTWSESDEVLSKHDFAASANPILYLETPCIY
jgi:hypothetical protein